MSILHLLASALDRRDEVPNQELARQLAANGDKAGIKELVDNLANKSKDIRHDCIKVLYETGEIDPTQIVAHISVFTDLLENKDNRLQWGAMTALQTLVKEKPKEIHATLPKLMAVADKGSVITKDQLVKILVQLGGISAYKEAVVILLMEQLQKAFANQVPMYAELALPLIHKGNRELFINTLTLRLQDIEKESKRKRVEKIIEKAGKVKL